MKVPSSLITLLCLITIHSTKMYLPKQSDYIPFNDIYAKDLARSGRNSFWLEDKDGASAMISSYPVRPNAVTEVTFKLANGNFFDIGCGKKNMQYLKDYGNLNNWSDAVFVFTFNGRKYTRQQSVPYTLPFVEDDTITMTIDLRPYKGDVSYAKNGLPLGIAFGGLDEWEDDIYIIISFFKKSHRLQVINYTVRE